MRPARHLALLCLWAAAAALPARAYEENLWPFVVLEKDDAGKTVSWTAAGPFLFSQPTPGGGTLSGFRPLHVREQEDAAVKTDMLYPLFYFRQYDQGYTWSVLQLIDGRGAEAGAVAPGNPADRHVDIWPFLFSYSAADPADSYTGFFPVVGTVKGHLGFKEVSWVAFPLYAESTKGPVHTTYTPWPLVRTIRGDRNGFAVWPLFGSVNGPRDGHSFYALWPFLWDNTVAPAEDAPPGTPPTRQVGVLPFYARESGPGTLNETYLWPFFGHAERTVPYRYTETRYLWPFLVQGHGEKKTVERFAPVYAYSNVQGLESTWRLWPLLHTTTWVDGDVRQTKTQLFYFIYWSLDQESTTRPALAHAYKQHLWPLASIWDNGAGSRQVQVPSPLEVFFPDNRDVRRTWTPFFALYRYDHQPDGRERSSLLWNAVTWRSGPSGELEEFHLGPLFGVRRSGPRRGIQILGFDFPANTDKTKPAQP
jgi:hypothetical protein